MTTMIDHVHSKDTRRSIRKLFSLGSIMSKGSNNPITLHSADENAFARVWSLIAEIMVANGELNRNTKEKIADLVSKKNECPICIGLHGMMVVASDEGGAESEEHRRQAQALEYAELLCTATRMKTPITLTQQHKLTLLNDSAKAEVALVVLLFTHMNRVVSALLGEEISTAMFSVPRPMARTMERSWLMGAMTSMMKPFLSGGMKEKHKLGCSEELFKSDSDTESESDPFDLVLALPEHLRGAVAAGPTRVNALTRLVEWVDYFYESYLEPKGILPKNLLDLLDDPASSPPSFHMRFRSPDKVLRWANDSVFKSIDALDVNEEQKTLGKTLVLVSFAAQSVPDIELWKNVLKTHKERKARSILIWWSIRVTLAYAKGLAPGDLLEDEAGQ